MNLDIDAQTVVLLADEIAARLDERQRARSGWVTADVVADHLGVDRDYVYEHAAQLGARRLGDGPKARLRFRLDLVDEALPCYRSRGSEDPSTRVVERKQRRRRRPGLGTGTPLLPIRGAAGPPGGPPA